MSPKKDSVTRSVTKKVEENSPSNKRSQREPRERREGNKYVGSSSHLSFAPQQRPSHNPISFSASKICGVYWLDPSAAAPLSDQRLAGFPSYNSDIYFIPNGNGDVFDRERQDRRWKMQDIPPAVVRQVVTFW